MKLAKTSDNKGWLYRQPFFMLGILIIKRYNVSDNDNNLMTRKKSYKGQKFGRLTILEDGGGRDKVLCLCECGTRKSIFQLAVVSGRTSSCGCLRRERAKGGFPKKPFRTHGHSKSPLYSTWRNMMKRCYYQNAINYSRYGAKGVYVCERWHEIANFIEDMANTWFEGAQLDKDKFAKPGEPKSYSPETCCWVSSEENAFIRQHSFLYPITRDVVLDPFISYKLATT